MDLHDICLDIAIFDPANAAYGYFVRCASFRRGMRHRFTFEDAS
jgi:hypothetical protein